MCTGGHIQYTFKILTTYTFVLLATPKKSPSTSLAGIAVYADFRPRGVPLGGKASLGPQRPLANFLILWDRALRGFLILVTARPFYAERSPSRRLHLHWWRELG
jgi:hypothetical protein